MNSVLLPSRSLSLRRLTFRPFRPQPPCCHLPITAFARYLSRMGRRVYPPGRSGRIGGNAVTRSEVRHWLAGSPTGLAESGSLSYGLVIHLRLLPTPPRGDAVTFGYRFVTQTWWGLAPHRSNVFRDALAQQFTAGRNRKDISHCKSRRDDRMGNSRIIFGRPYGTKLVSVPLLPSDESLGYCQTTLRVENPRIYRNITLRDVGNDKPQMPLEPFDPGNAARHAVTLQVIAHRAA